MRTTTFVLSLVMLACPLPVHAGSPGDEPVSTTSASTIAEEPSDRTRLHGIYFGAGGGLGYENFDRGYDFGGFRRPPVETVGGIVNVRAGYRLHPRVSAEVLWEYNTGWESDFDRRVFSQIEGWSLTANLKAYATLTRIRPFAVFGIGMARLEPDRKMVFCDPSEPVCGKEHAKTGFVARFGGGIDMFVTESWQVGLETAYVLMAADLEGFDYITSGLVVAYTLS